MSEIEEIPVNEIDIVLRRAANYPVLRRLPPQESPYGIFMCRDADIPLNQHGAHAAER